MITTMRVAENSMCKFQQFEIERQFACAKKLETQQAVSLNQQLIILAADVPEMWAFLFHFLGGSSSRRIADGIAHIGKELRRGAARRGTMAHQIGILWRRSQAKHRHCRPGKAHGFNQRVLFVLLHRVADQEKIETSWLNFLECLP